MTWPRQSDHRHRKAAIAQVRTVSKYFSIASLRPVKTPNRALAARRRRPAREPQFGARQAS